MTRTHEIKLDGYGAHTTLAEDRPIMLLGTAESYGIEMLHIAPGKDWAELTITATFNAADGTSTDILMGTDGNIAVPTEATAKSGSGRIVFAGVSNGVQRISCDLEYFVVAHSAINGVQSGGTAPSWFEQAVTRFMPAGGIAGQVLTKKTDADFEAEWQDNKGGGTTDHSKLENRDAADQHPISAITGLENALANKQPSGEYLTQEDLQAATNTALAAAKASGEFDGADGITPTIGDNGNWYLGSTDTGKPSRGEKGPKGDTGATGATGADGKSAYSYAQDGGYTGTEAEFAAKLAAEGLDRALYVVNITSSGGTYSADKTYDEIVQAYNEGKYSIVANIDGVYITPLSEVERDVAMFSGIIEDRLVLLGIFSNNTVVEATVPLATTNSKLPNPYPITFTGAVSETYDGSSAKTIEIPSGGASGLCIYDNYDVTLISFAQIDQTTLPIDAGIEITTDDNGNPFSYDGIVVWSDIKSGISYTDIKFNGIKGFYLPFPHGVKTSMSVYITDGKSMRAIRDGGSSVYIKQTRADINEAFYPAEWIADIPEKLTSVHLCPRNKVVSGTFYKIWGLTKK